MDTFIFRAKSLDNEHSKKGTWVYGNLQKNVDNFGNEKFTIKEINFNEKSRGWRFYNVNENTIGLQSEFYINGNQCSDGDIYSGDKYIYIVRFRKGAFYLDHHKEYLGEWGLLSRMMDEDFKEIRRELIHKGNVYENSDLLS